MGVRLDTQHAARKARRRLTSCYLCGCPLPPSGPGRKKLLRAEHVIPRAMLDLADAGPEHRWPLVLDVHPECDDRYKAPRDQLAKIISIMGSAGPRAWSPEELGLFRKVCDVAYRHVGGVRRPVIDGADEILYAAHLWARGCHAALYGQSLPWPISQWTACPGTPCLDEEEARERTTGMLGVLASAMEREGADTLSLRGGAIKYNCVWARSLDDGEEEPWMCIWALDLPGAEQWSMLTQGRGVPWHGVYASATRPATASEVEVSGRPP